MRRPETDLLIFGTLTALSAAMLVALTRSNSPAPPPADTAPPPRITVAAEQQWIDQLTSADPVRILAAQRQICRWDQVQLDRWKLDLLVISQAIRLDARDRLSTAPPPATKAIWLEIDRTAREMVEGIASN